MKFFLLEIEAMNKSQVPENIFFGNQIFTFPTFSAIGWDMKIIWQIHPQTDLEIGRWLYRDDTIVEVRVTLYHNIDKPKLPWNKDSTYERNFILKSPISGLVIGMQYESVTNLSGRLRFFPIILIPKNEPPYHKFRLDFYNELNELFNSRWELIQSPTNKGLIRLSERFSKEEINLKPEQLELPKLIDSYPEYSNMSGNIQNLRAYNLDLRDKLLHLVKDE